MARTTRAMPAVDRYRADGDGATGDVYDARLFREEVFVPLLSRGRPAPRPPRRSVRPGAWAIADPDGKLAAARGQAPRRARWPRPRSTAPSATPAPAAALLGLVQASADGGSDAHRPA